ncbi:MAG: hypothetical protein L3K18_09495 [Thermoplasmata archaeon]|nr:hypothetical protein [Thermoplasmata archaeon]
MRPLIHVSRNRCAIYRQLRNEGRVDIWGRTVPGKESYRPPGSTPASAAPSGPGTEAAPSGTSAETPGPAPNPAPEAKIPLGKRLASGFGVKYRDVGTTPPATPGEAAQVQTWDVSPETSERFWATIIGFIGTIFNLLTGWLEIPPVPKEVFEIDPGQAFVFRTAMRGFTTNILIKVFRAKSPEDADRIVAGLTGFLGFGMMAMKIALHMIIHVPKSPRLKKFREAREAAKAEKEAAKAAKAARGPAAPTGPAPAVA